MQKFNISIVGKSIELICEYPQTRSLCSEYITDAPAEFTVRLGEGDMEAEREHARREYALEGITSPIPTDSVLEGLAIYRKIAEKMLDFGVILFHGSVIAVDGEGYLFTAKSGTGKSTHTGLWRERFGSRAVMVNDDKPLIAIGEEGVTVWGTPWCGKHRLSTNIGVPLCAVAVLERGVENEILEISPMEAFPTLLSQTYRFSDPAKMQRTLALLDRLTRSVRLCRLRCNMQPEAAEVAYRGMKGNENEA